LLSQQYFTYIISRIMASSDVHLKCFENGSKWFQKCIVLSYVKFLVHLEIISAEAYQKLTICISFWNVFQNILFLAFEHRHNSNNNWCKILELKWNIVDIELLNTSGQNIFKEYINKNDIHISPVHPTIFQNIEE